MRRRSAARRARKRLHAPRAHAQQRRERYDTITEHGLNAVDEAEAIERVRGGDG
jgi:hypothetical protein